MINSTVPCCYFPTTVVLIDDDEIFLKSIHFKLSRHFFCAHYKHPIEALTFLNNHYEPRPFTQQCLLSAKEEPLDHRSIDIDITAIHQKVYDATRFSTISVLVVDYSMPGMNGDEFCKQLRHSGFKIILLTGEADEKIAIDLFNQEIIHRFIRKDSIEFVNTLHQTIKELQHNYFSDLSKIILHSLTQNSHDPLTCLNDSIFIHFFHQHLKKTTLAEYYLLNEQGSFLFLNEIGQPSWLAMATPECLKGFYEIAQYSDSSEKRVSASVIESLKNQQKLPFFFTKEELNITPDKWQYYLHPATPLVGRTIYYYAHITDPHACHFDSKQVLSCKQFRDEQEE